jgi:hypothetical protein
MPKSLQTTAKNKADKLFSEIIRSVGRCENCGKGAGIQLQTAHWISRRYANTRTDFDNAFCLCAGCHRFFTADPTAWALWAIEKRGRETYERLREAANEKSKIWWPDELKRLQEIAREAS